MAAFELLDVSYFPTKSEFDIFMRISQHDTLLCPELLAFGESGLDNNEACE